MLTKPNLKILLLLTFVLPYLAIAQNESEPNNTFAQADGISGANISGSVGSVGDANDYFVFVPAQNGRVKLNLAFTNLGPVLGSDMTIYAYNRAKSSIGTRSITNPPLGIGSDSLILYCREADTIYVLLSANGAFNYTLTKSVVTVGTNDVEPNNSFAQATFVAMGTTSNGRISHTGTVNDGNDNYKVYIPANGRFRVFTTLTNTGANNAGDFFVYAYNKAQSGIGTSALINRPVGLNPTDTLNIFCREADTMYVRIAADDGCFSYAFSYDVVTVGTNDAEPNNSFAQATFVAMGTTANGRISHTGTVNDANDYYKVSIPANGKFRVFTTLTNTGANNAGDFFVYAYNKAQSGIGTSTLINRPVGLNPTDTLNIFCREADTMYVRIAADDGCFSYAFSYDVVTVGTNDAEPNNSFAQASFVAMGTTANGRISHTGTANDANDYYKVYIPANGRFRVFTTLTNTGANAAGDFFVYAYNKAQSGIGTSTLINRPVGLNPTDTLNIFCREADTMYVRIAADDGCFSYAFSYDVVTSGTNDVEPNNTLQTSTLVLPNDTIKGHVGYVSQQSDANDYFKFFAGTNSSITLSMSTTNTSGNAGSDFYFYLLNSAGQQIAVRSYTNANAVGTFTDQLVLPCVASDTVYLRTTSSGCFAYTFIINVVNTTPTASIKSSRMGNTFGFIAQTTNADSVYWDFDDGTGSALKYPTKDFGIGVYNVKLKAFYKACNLVTTDSFSVEVKGIEYFTPTNAGSGGDAILQIFGGGLDTLTTVVLSKGGNQILPIGKLGNPNRKELQALFDLHSADEGLYDVTIQIPGEPALVFPNAFSIDSLQYPFAYSEIIGPSRWRINRDTRFVLSVGNSGNVKANGVITFLVWPKSVNVTFLTEWFRPPDSGSYTLNVDDTIFTLKYEDIQVLYDPSHIAGEPTPIDSFAGVPFDGYFMPIQIPVIGPGSTYDLPFIANAPSTGVQRFITYTSMPNLFGSCGNGSWNDAIENTAVQVLDAWDVGLGLAKMDKTPVGWTVKALKGSTTNLANLGQAMGAYYNYYTGVTTEVTQSLPAKYDVQVSAGYAQMGSAVLEVGVDKLVDVGADRMMKNQTDDLNKWLANTPDASLSSVTLAVDQLNNFNDMRNFVRNAYKTAKDLKTLKDELTRLKELAIDCPELQKQLEALEKEVDNEMKQRKKKEKNTNSVTSLDPNGIYGPNGIDSLQYVNSTDRHSFMVTFENVDTASASAQIVKISIPIDTGAFNLSTFSFGDFSIGSHIYSVPKNRQEFTLDINLRKTRGMDVRVFAYLDTITKSIECQFVSIDTLTLDLPALEGFLPPNVNAPEGEGYITFNIGLKKAIADGYNTFSQATIVFDENEAILTEPWENVIDKIPSSSIATASSTNDLITINTNGTDATSGVGFYHLYVSENSGPWEQLTGTTSNSIQLIGEPGKKYDFYVRSVDRVGNEEMKSPLIEASVTIPENINTESTFNPSFILLPNPSDGNVSAQANGNFADVEVLVYSITGQVVSKAKHSFTVGDKVPLHLQNLKQGAYLVHFTNKAGKTNVQKLLIVKVN